MWSRSSNRREFSRSNEKPMRVQPEILQLCRVKIESQKKNALRNFILPLVKRIYRLEEVGEGMHWGRNSNVRGSCFGSYSSFGHSAQFNGTVIVGDLTMISSEVQVVGLDHIFSNPSIPMRINFPEVDRPPTIIESDCWIGARVTIMEGIRIGRGSIIGAGSIVTRSIPPYSLAVGSPARVLRNRFNDSQAAEHDRLLYGRAMPDRDSWLSQHVDGATR